MTMEFGKYKGEDLTDVPLQYIKWLEQQNITDDLRAELNTEIKRRESEVTSRGRNVVLIPKAEEMRVRAFTNYLIAKIRKTSFFSMRTPEIETMFNMWKDQYLSKFERVE